MRALLWYTLMAALRDRLFIALLALLGVASMLSFFLGSTAVVEQRELAATLAGGSLRMIAAIGIVLFVCFHLRRAFDNREIEMILARPISRTRLVLGFALGILVLCAVMAAIAGLLVIVVAEPPLDGLGLWTLSLLFECIILGNAGLFFGMVLPSAVTSALACFAFYILARMIGLLMGIAQASAGWSVSDLPGRVMEGIGMILPRLDLFGQSSWLVYGVGGEASVDFILIQGVVFALLLVLAAASDFSRREF